MKGDKKKKKKNKNGKEVNMESQAVMELLFIVI